MTAPITPDERAAMRRRYEPGPMGSPERTDIERKASQGLTARVDVPRLLDALDTAEASLRSSTDLIARLQQGKRFADADVVRLRRERDEARSAAIIAAPAHPAPVWDEDTVTEAVALAMFPNYFTDDRQPLRVFTETRSDTELREAEREAARHRARQALAVVREHGPVRPDRETIARAIHAAHRPTTGPTPAWDDEAPAWRQTYLDFADAVLALWPGESRATVQAEALRDAADAVTEIDGRRDDAAARWLRARADRLEKGADRG